MQRLGNIHSAVPSTGIHSGLRASSASSPTLSRQRASTRPPVPLFPNNSTGTEHQRQHNSGLFESNLPGSLPIPSKSQPVLTRSDMDCFDFSRAAAEASASLHIDSYEAFNNAIPHAGNERVNANSFYDCFDAMSSCTVSPQDVLLDASSAPNSGVLSNLTTPDNFTLESPDVSYIKTSPYSDTMEINENWPSLFAQETEEAKPESKSFINPLQASPALHHVAPAMSRTSSSGQTSSRSSHQGRPSTSSGIVKRKTQPLPPIEVDPNDTVAMKRARNTLAARNSRTRRAERTEALEIEVRRLSEEVEMWRNRAIDRGHPGQ